MTTVGGKHMGFKTSFGIVNLSISFDDNLTIVDKNYIENTLRLKIKDMDELFKNIKITDGSTDALYD